MDNADPIQVPAPQDAILAFETAQTNYSNTTSSQAAAQAKADAANAALTQTNDDKKVAAVALVAACDVTIASLTALKASVAPAPDLGA